MLFGPARFGLTTETLVAATSGVASFSHRDRDRSQVRQDRPLSLVAYELVILPTGLVAHESKAACSRRNAREKRRGRGNTNLPVGQSMLLKSLLGPVEVARSACEPRRARAGATFLTRELARAGRRLYFAAIAIRLALPRCGRDHRPCRACPRPRRLRSAASTSWQRAGPIMMPQHPRISPEKRFPTCADALG